MMAGKWVPSLALLLIIVAIWQAVIVLFKVPSYLIASPSAIGSELASHWSLLLTQAEPTAIEVIVGFACSLLIAFPLAIMVVYFGIVGRAVYPLIVTSQVVPKVAVAPVFVILLGIGLFPKVLVVFLISFFPIVISTVLGLRSTDPEMLEMVQSMGAGKVKAFVKVRFPDALPVIFSGIKVSITLAVVGAIVAEFVGASQGLGYLILEATGEVETSLVYADLVVMTAMGVILYGFVEVAEALVLRGRRLPASEQKAMFTA